MTPTAQTSLATRAYAACLRLLPPSVRASDGDEMVTAFADLWVAALGPGARLRLALRLFGRLPGVVLLEWLDVLEITGDGRNRGGMMSGWVMNLRYALRTLRKAPAFALTSVALIGIGVGAVTTIFTVVDHVLLRPLPYPDADRLVTVEEGAYSAHAYRAFQELNSVEAWGAAYDEDANLTGVGDPIRLRQAGVSERLLSILGARPALGRLFVDGDFQTVGVAVVSHSTWVDVFGADPSVIGRSLRIDGLPVEVVGVLAPDFEPPLNAVGAHAAIWRPIDWTRPEYDSPGYHNLQVVGRLAPGATLADLAAELEGVASRLRELYPDTYVGDEPPDMPPAGLQDATTQRVRTGLHLLLGAVALLLLVACLNVAHLFLARGLARTQEMAVRRAMGAGAADIARQLLVESLLIGGVGGTLGLLLGSMGLRAYLRLDPSELPRATAVVLDLRVLAFAAAVSVATAVLFGLAPALRTAGRDVGAALKTSTRSATSGRGASRVRSILVVAEVALSLVLVAQAGLLLRSFMNVQAERPGFDPDGLWTVPLAPTGPETPAEYVAQMEEIRASLAAVPGVVSATHGLTLPFEFTGGGRCCWSQNAVVDGEDRPDVRLALHPVTGEYFETLGLPWMAGRVWARAEESQAPVPAVFSERLAVDLFGSAAAAMDRVVGRSDRLQLRVVGVVGDTPHYGLDQSVPQAAYIPMSRLPFSIPLAHFGVRVAGEAPEGLERALREAVWRVAPDVPVPSVRPMRSWMSDSLAGRRFDSALFAAFGAIALLLAAAGLYGTLLYTVRQQSRELGIRLALGAARSRVEGDIVRRGVSLAVVGSAIGVAGSWWVGRFVESRLYEVEAADPAALGGAVAALVAAAALASWVPARRAGSTDPLETLRAD